MNDGKSNGRPLIKAGSSNELALFVFQLIVTVNLYHEYMRFSLIMSKISLNQQGTSK